MEYKIQRKIALCLLILVFCMQTVLADFIQDSFNDGVINPDLWRYQQTSGRTNLVEGEIIHEHLFVNMSINGDARIDSQNPASNDGNHPDLVVGRASSVSNRRAVLFFNNTPSINTSQLEEATLYLTIKSVNNPFNLSVHQLNQSFVEDDVTWNEYSMGNNWGTAGGDFDPTVVDVLEITTAGVQVQLNVTDIVFNWLNGDSNDGILLKELDELVDGTNGEIYSEEEGDSTRHPYIEVHYFEPVGVTPLGNIRISGNETNTNDLEFLESLISVPSGSDAEMSIQFRVVSMTTSNGNDKASLGMTNKTDDDSWSGSVDDTGWCGVAFRKQGNQNFNFVRNYPTASIIFTTTTPHDTNVHNVSITVRREPSDSQTCYVMEFDDQTSTHCQTNKCADPELKFSLSAQSVGTNAYFEVYYDNFSYNTPLNINETGAYCESNDDCASGLCEYNFCTLKRERMECISNSQCLSGVCDNGHCTKNSAWDLLETSKTQQFGDDSATNNFIALFFMVGLSIMVIAYGQSLSSVLIATGIFFVLGLFFTIVGWLSPFIMVGFIVMALMFMVFGFMIFGRSD